MNVFSLFRNYLPLEKGWALHLHNPLYTQGCFVPSLIENDPAIPTKKIFKFCQYIFAFL